MAKCAPKPLRKFALGGSLTTTDLNKFAQGRSQPQQQKNPLETIDNQIAMGNAVDNSNLTMSEKAALGLGTTSADASALRQRTSALSTLREGMASQLQPQNESAWIGGGTGDPLKSTWNSPGVTYGTRSFADGGKVDAAEELLKRMAGKYGVSAESQPVPQQAIAAPSAVQPRPATTLGEVVEAMRNRQAQIDKAVGYANGGKITGPGTPTSDSIPAKVRETGEPIKVSTGERIVSAAQEVLLGRIAEMLGFDSVDAMLEAGTGKPVGPTIKHGKGFGFGGRIGDDPENPTPAQQYGTKMLSMKDFAATPEQKASYVSAAESFKQDRGIPSIVSTVTAPQVKVSDIPQLGDAPSVTPAETQQQSPAVENKPAPSIGSITMGGRTKSLAAMAAGSNGYVDSAGKPVEKWEQTARYAQAMEVNDRMAKLARQMERDRYIRDTQADITNPRVQAIGMANLARMDREDEQASAQQTADIDRQMKGQALAAGRLETEFAKRLTDPSLTPEQRLALRSDMLAFKGKNPNEHRFIKGDNIKVYNEMGQVIGEQPGGFLDTATMRMIGGQESSGSGQATKLPAPKSEAEMRALPKGTRYTAPDGSVRVKQ